MNQNPDRQGGSSSGIRTCIVYTRDSVARIPTAFCVGRRQGLGNQQWYNAGGNFLAQADEF